MEYENLKSILYVCIYIFKLFSCLAQVTRTKPFLDQTVTTLLKFYFYFFISMCIYILKVWIIKKKKTLGHKKLKTSSPKLKVDQNNIIFKKVSWSIYVWHDNLLVWCFGLKIKILKNCVLSDTLIGSIPFKKGIERS